MRDKMMQLITPMEKSHSTLCSTSSMVSSSNNSGQNGDQSNLSSNISDTDSELSYTDCDVTLVDDVDYKCDPSNDAEKMLFQVMEVLRYEQEVINQRIYLLMITIERLETIHERIYELY